MQLISISRKVELIIKRRGKSIKVRPAKFRNKEEKSKILNGYYAGKAVHVGTEGKVAYFFTSTETPTQVIAEHVAKETGATEYVIVNIGDDVGMAMTNGLKGTSDRDIWAAMGRLIRGRATMWYLCVARKIVFIKRKLPTRHTKYIMIAAVIAGLDKSTGDGPRPSPSDCKPLE